MHYPEWMRALFPSLFYFDKIKERLSTSDHMCVSTFMSFFHEVFQRSNELSVIGDLRGTFIKPRLQGHATQVQINTQKWEEQETISMLMGQIQTAPPSITCSNITKLQLASPSPSASTDAGASLRILYGISWSNKRQLKRKSPFDKSYKVTSF